MGKRGPKPRVELVIEKLEETGNIDAADIAREAAGLPPRILSRDEDFVETVKSQVSSAPLGFHASSPEEASNWVMLAREIPSPNSHLKYDARLTTPTRLEVKLIPA